MATDPGSLAIPPGTRPLPLLRWIALAALLLVELLALTLRFDTGSLARTPTWWADLLGETPQVPRLALVIAAATLVFGGGRLRGELGEVTARHRSLPLWPFFLAHLAAFAGFAWLTGFLFEGGLQDSAHPGPWVLLWAGLAALTLGLWAAAALPANLWLPLARPASGPLLIGIGVGLTAWVAGQLTGWLWHPLAASTFWVVRSLLGLVVGEVVCDPDALVVGTPSFAVQIAPACSGCEGMGLIWAFLAAYLGLHRKELRFPAALLLLPMATAIIWLANAVRIAALIGVGACWSREVALGGFHSQAGWLAFNGVALGVVVLSQRARWFTLQPAEASPGGNATAAYLVPLLALVGTMMATAALSSGFDWLYSLRVAAVGVALWCFRRHYRGVLTWSWSWTAVGIGVAAYGLWLALEPAADSRAAEAFTTALGGVPRGWAVAWLTFRILGSVVTVPLAEELAFRGYLTRRLIAADFERVPLRRFTWLSFLVSSLLFGLLHGRWLAGTLAGLLYALALYRRGRLGDAVLAHAVTNALIAVHVLATGAWGLWT